MLKLGQREALHLAKHVVAQITSQPGSDAGSQESDRNGGCRRSQCQQQHPCAVDEQILILYGLRVHSDGRIFAIDVLGIGRIDTALPQRLCHFIHLCAQIRHLLGREHSQHIIDARSLRQLLHHGKQLLLFLAQLRRLVWVIHRLLQGHFHLVDPCHIRFCL